MYTSKLFFDFKDQSVKYHSNKLCLLLDKDFLADYKLHYYNDLINDFEITIDNKSLIHGTKGILNILDSAAEIRNIIYDASLKTVKHRDMYRAIAIDDAVVVSIDQLKFIDEAFKTIYNKLKGDPEKDILIEADRQSLYYAYLIYLWTIKDTFVVSTTSRDSVGNVATYIDAIIGYLSSHEDFKEYKSDYLHSIVEKIIDIHRIRIDINKAIDAANKDLFNLFDVYNDDDTILELINGHVVDGVIDPHVSMSYDDKLLIFNFEYYDCSGEQRRTVFGNTIRFGQSKYKAVFHSLNTDAVFLECKYIPFYGIYLNNQSIQHRDKFIDIKRLMEEYSTVFNSNCELLDKISLGSFLTGKDTYHFNINEFKGKLEKHVQVTELFLSEYSFMLKHLYYTFKTLQFDANTNFNKIRVL